MARTIKKIRSSETWKDIRIIWLNSISEPDLNIITHNNNMKVLAANEFLRKELKGLDVEEFDVFGLTYPYNNQIIDYLHYLAFQCDNNTALFYGNVGLHMANHLLYQICPSI